MVYVSPRKLCWLDSSWNSAFVHVYPIIVKIFSKQIIFEMSTTIFDMQRYLSAFYSKHSATWDKSRKVPCALSLPRAVALIVLEQRTLQQVRRPYKANGTTATVHAWSVFIRRALTVKWCCAANKASQVNVCVVVEQAVTFYFSNGPEATVSFCLEPWNAFRAIFRFSTKQAWHADCWFAVAQRLLAADCRPSQNIHRSQSLPLPSNAQSSPVLILFSWERIETKQSSQLPTKARFSRTAHWQDKLVTN